MPTPQNPYIVYGIVLDSDGVAVTSKPIVGHDRTTNEKVIASTNSSGQYLLDLANLASGYTSGDSITIYIRFAGYTGETSFTLSGEGGIQKNITALIGVNVSTLRTDFWDGIYNTLQTGVYAISTNNIHSAMNDRQISDEGYPQVIIYPPEIDSVAVTATKTRLIKTVRFTIEVYHNSAENMKILVDEVENKIWSAQDVWRGLFLHRLNTTQEDYDWWTEGREKIHKAALETTFTYVGTV